MDSAGWAALPDLTERLEQACIDGDGDIVDLIDQVNAFLRRESWSRPGPKVSSTMRAFVFVTVEDVEETLALITEIEHRRRGEARRNAATVRLGEIGPGLTPGSRLSVTEFGEHDS